MGDAGRQIDPRQKGARALALPSGLPICLLTLLALLALHGLASAAWARPGQITEFQLPATGESGGIAAGPDGDMWATEGDANAIARITPSGEITEFPLPTAGSWPNAITAGPDGNLWFTEDGNLYFPSGVLPNAIGRITPGGRIAEFPLPTHSEPTAITAGPDGALWFTEEGANAIGRITTSGQITEYPLSQGSKPEGIASGPDDSLWFTATETIDSISPSGKITRFPLPKVLGAPRSIARGKDGSLWFTAGEKIGRITPRGHLSTFQLPHERFANRSEARDIATGPDGNLWFTERTLGVGIRLGRIAPSGQITEFRVGGNWPGGVAAGPDGNVWYTDATYCEGGGLTCMQWKPVPSRVGRIRPGLLAIEIKDESVRVRYGRIKLKLGCAGGKAHSACRGILRLKLASKGVLVYRAPYSVGSGSYRTIPLPLNPKALRLIARNYPLLSVVQATATVKGGRGAKGEVALQIRRPLQ